MDFVLVYSGGSLCIKQQLFSHYYPTNKKPHERRSLTYSIFDNHNELECDAFLIYKIKIKSNNLIKRRTMFKKKELVRITDMSVVVFERFK